MTDEELEHAVRCARDEEVARVVKYLHGYADGLEAVGRNDEARQLRVVAEGVLVGLHRGLSEMPGDFKRTIERVLHAGDPKP